MWHPPHTHTHGLALCGPQRSPTEDPGRAWGAGLPVLLSHRRDGGSSCVGPTRRHRFCHLEVKPTQGGGQLPRPPPPHPGPGCLLSVLGAEVPSLPPVTARTASTALPAQPQPPPPPGGEPPGPLRLPRSNRRWGDGTRPPGDRWAGRAQGSPTFPSLAPLPPQSCPPGARDFRAEQCGEFDSREFQGRWYRWLPYYAGECSPAVPPASLRPRLCGLLTRTLRATRLLTACGRCGSSV